MNARTLIGKCLWCTLFIAGVNCDAVCDGQEVIYLRSPATLDGRGPLKDGEILTPNARVIAGPGGVVVVELKGWPATDQPSCTLFLIASHGREVRVPPRASAKPRPCNGGLDDLNRALSGAAISTSVMLFPAGKGDVPPGATTAEDLHNRLGRRKPRGASVGATRSTSASRGASIAATRLAETIRVESATYGRNCGAAQGNATAHVSNACNGKNTCEYVIDYTIIGDPARGCVKGYDVIYTCVGTGTRKTGSVTGEEAGFKRRVVLSCQ